MTPRMCSNRSITVATYSFPAMVGISVMSPTQRVFDALAVKSRRSRSGWLRRGLVLPGQPVATLDPPRDQALAAHRVGHRLLRHHALAGLQIGVQPR